jgi:hypothetical protein
MISIQYVEEIIEGPKKNYELGMTGKRFLAKYGNGFEITD